jgi:hypothetical protein
MALVPRITRTLFGVVFALTIALGLVIYSTGGPWYGIAILSAMALAAGSLCAFASDELLVRVDRWIASVLHWLP